MYSYLVIKTFYHASCIKLPMRYDPQTFYFTMSFLNKSSIYNINFIGQADPDYLSNYFTIFQELTTVIIYLKKLNSWQLKHTHISNILITLQAFQRNYPTHWCHSLILRYATRNSGFCLWVFGISVAITVSFLAYLFIFTPDKVSLISRLSLTSLFCTYVWS